MGRSSQECHWWVAHQAHKGERWKRTSTAPSKDKAIQLLTPQWHDFKSKAWWLQLSLLIATRLLRATRQNLERLVGLPAVLWRTEERLEFLESMQGNRGLTRVDSWRDPLPCRWAWKAIRRNLLGKETGGRCLSCAAGLCSVLSGLLAKWHFLFFSFKFVGARHAQMAPWMVLGLLWFVVLGTRWEDEGVRKQF